MDRETDATLRCRNWRAKQRLALEQTFTRWLELIAKVPPPLKTLTQDDWIKACRYFGKCAICEDESIDARAFFVAFSFGGRYANWNVIPVCEKCAVTLRRKQNPFIRYEDAAPRIVKYLRPILERTIADETNL